MLSKDTSFLGMLAALVVSGLLAHTGWTAHQIVSAKAQAQAATVSDFQEWKRQYTQLLPLQERWSSSLRPTADAQDLYSLHKILGNQPQSNPDTLLVERLEEVEQNGLKLGAQRVCLSSGAGHPGMVFVEKDFATLMQGLHALTQRVDIQMGSIELSQDQGKARAVVSPLCLLLRTEESAT